MFSDLDSTTILAILVPLSLLAAAVVTAVRRSGRPRGRGRRPRFDHPGRARGRRGGPPPSDRDLPPDWYPDPMTGRGTRFWDGDRWTDQVRR